jgi:hypothetical protein
VPRVGEPYALGAETVVAEDKVHMAKGHAISTVMSHMVAESPLGVVGNREAVV